MTTFAPTGCSPKQKHSCGQEDLAMLQYEGKKDLKCARETAEAL